MTIARDAIVERLATDTSRKKGKNIMRKLLPIALLIAVGAMLAISARHPVSAASAPVTARFTADGKLERPVDYRRWSTFPPASA